MFLTVIVTGSPTLSCLISGYYQDTGATAAPLNASVEKFITTTMLITLPL